MSPRAMARKKRSQRIPVLPATIEPEASVRPRGLVSVVPMVLFLAFLLWTGQAMAGSRGISAGEQNMALPKQVGIWELSESPRRIEPKGIFDYMNGGGELYLGYRFRYLDVYDYRDPSDIQILLEVYQMEASDDAFGLLSLDSDGQEVTFGGDSAPAGRGIYGAGLLRLWSGDIFARILAEKETPESREAVMQLGKSVTAGRAQSPVPSFIRSLPAEFAGYQLDSRQVTYFRSYLVLNSVYFLSTQNILKLDLKTEAVMASYRSTGVDQPKSGRLLVVRYETPARALAASHSFMESYLPEHKCKASGPGTPATGACLVEDGWVGYRVIGRNLVLAFQLPSEQIARLSLDKSAEQLHNWEKSHE